MKAMLLAAGRGERLRPLTDTLPKALVPVGGKPLVVRHLERLRRAGCREVVINVSYLGERIAQALGDGAACGLRIEYSREAEPLETAGGIAQALPLLGSAPFLLVNADIYCEFDPAPLLRRSLDQRLVHLVLVPNPAYHVAGDFAIDGTALRNAGAPRYTYAGIALVSPKLVAPVRPGEKAPLAPLLRKAADADAASAEIYEGPWQDVGTLARLAELESWLASRHEDR